MPTSPTKFIRYRDPVTRIASYGVVVGGALRPITGTPFGRWSYRGGSGLSLERARVLPPSEPSKIVLVGLNYREHARELNMPLPKDPILFMKPPSSVIGHRGVIRYPSGIGRVDYEAELAVVIKRKCRAVRKGAADDYILGFTCLNDVTARSLQKADGQWTRAKSFDTFCPVGPYVVSGIDTSDIGVRLRLDGILRQSSNTGDMIFGVSELISFVSRCMTLLPGDIIATGTPPGIGPLRRGSTVTVEIDGVGALENTVR